MRALVISERAEADLREIWRWSYDRFGEAQADRYLDELDDGCRSAAQSRKTESNVTLYDLATGRGSCVSTSSSTPSPMTKS